MKSVAFIGSLLLSMGIVTTAAAAPDAMEGFSGLVIWLLLGYCAIVVLAQLIAALTAVRRMLDDMVSKKAPSKRIWLR